MLMGLSWKSHNLGRLVTAFGAAIVEKTGGVTAWPQYRSRHIGRPFLAAMAAPWGIVGDEGRLGHGRPRLSRSQRILTGLVGRASQAPATFAPARELRQAFR